MNIPSAGDLVWVDFEPVRGSEQGGVRPAIVLSSYEFHSQSPKAIVCPVTGNLSPWPTKVFLPVGLKTRGCILADQVRTVHRSQRGFRFIEATPQEVLHDVRTVLASLLGISALA